MAALKFVGTAAAASAEQLGPWQVDWTTAPDGTRVHAASLYATSVDEPDDGLAEDPVTLAIACRPKGGERWTMWLRLNDKLSDADQVSVSISADGKDIGEQDWIVGTTGKTLQFDGSGTMAALKSARTVTLGWNLGWTWLWLSDEASFVPVELPAVLYLLSKSCRVPEP